MRLEPEDADYAAFRAGLAACDGPRRFYHRSFDADPLGTAVCNAVNDVFVPQPVTVPAGTAAYLVCVRNDWVAPPPANRSAAWTMPLFSKSKNRPDDVGKTM